MGYYAGIGSRSTPSEVQLTMTRLAEALNYEGWMLRSGGADGADTAFEMGIQFPHNHQVFLPSKYFNGRHSDDIGMYDASALPSFSEALKTVDKYHPAPSRLSAFARKLMARNAMQILGPDLQTPSSFVIAWTPGGKLEGGTAQALRIAADYNIPVFNLGSQTIYDSLSQWAGLGHNKNAESFQVQFLT